VRRFEGLPQLRQSRTDGARELVSARCRDHSLELADEKRILQTDSQACDRIAEGGLAEPDSSGCATDVPLIHEGFEGKQEIEVDAANIHKFNIADVQYPFHK